MITATRTHETWSGALTIHNLSDVADRVQAYLSGKRFTVYRSNEFFHHRPEIKRHIRLKTPMRIQPVENGRGGIIIDDSYGVWSLRTSATDPNDISTSTPYFQFFDDDMVAITAYNDAGLTIYEVMVVEEERTQNA